MNTEPSNVSRRRLLVAGHGMVAQRFLERLYADGDPGLAVTVLGEEPRPAYDRVHLSELFGGKAPHDLNLLPEGFCAEHGIDLRLGCRVEHLDREARRVTTAAGETFDYDLLVLATGSRPFVPPVPGSEGPDCFVYRTIEDVEAIQAAAAQAKVGAVIGGGLLGLEAAKALKDAGLETHVIEFAPRLMAVQVDDLGGMVLRRRIEELGVTVHSSASTQLIEAGSDRRCRLRFADGSELQTDMVVFSAGIRPRDDLARTSGLALGARGGVRVDDGCVSEDPAIYAIGECASWRGEQVFGLVAPCYRMADVAADRIRGRAEARFEGADLSTKLKLMGVDVASLGDAHGQPGTRTVMYYDETTQVYKKLVLSADGKKLVGGVLVGDAEAYGSLLQTMLNGLPLPGELASMVLPADAAAGGAEPGAGLAALPDEAILCSCNNVSKGAISAAIGGGCTTLGALKKATRCATSCGGCAPLVTQVLNLELAKRGLEVNRQLCEHFPYSRQELYDLVRVHRIESFDDLLARHGRGHGCDICKPTVASILASCWNGFVLERGRAVLQDTNDYYLANIQKDGTYSIVPRVPGGEISPDKLIVLGQVAKKYQLYTKITGGQRIDLFGARVEQLPLIWEELIAAGFETGQAYGKSVRTVKSCVGSTWCRYGVQDSVGLAIDLENRYKSLRSPHKLKFGVSGCTRECAEAQGKDVGVIATEKGWNLYVCGNGGIKPRHAELLASDLDRETLIRTIDRFLMYYIRTADRLQRTSTWRENLEGGLEHIREVVIDDKLGIAAELEAQMAHVVANFHDEWRVAVEDPKVRRRFRHFVNSEERDEGVLFVEERGQIRPARTEELATTEAQA